MVDSLVHLTIFVPESLIKSMEPYYGFEIQYDTSPEQMSFLLKELHHDLARKNSTCKKFIVP